MYIKKLFLKLKYNSFYFGRKSELNISKNFKLGLEVEFSTENIIHYFGFRYKNIKFRIPFIFLEYENFLKLSFYSIGAFILEKVVLKLFSKIKKYLKINKKREDLKKFHDNYLRKVKIDKIINESLIKNDRTDKEGFFKVLYACTVQESQISFLVNKILSYKKVIENLKSINKELAIDITPTLRLYTINSELKITKEDKKNLFGYMEPRDTLSENVKIVIVYKIYNHCFDYVIINADDNILLSKKTKTN